MNEQIEFKNNLEKILKKIYYIDSIKNTLYWDSKMYAPINARHGKQEMQEYMADQYYSVITSCELKDIINFYDLIDKHDICTKTKVKYLKQLYNRLINIPKELYCRYEKVSCELEELWHQARKKNDFNVVKDKLQSLINIKSQLLAYESNNKVNNRYDIILDINEPGVTQKEIDPVFNELKYFLLNTIQKEKFKPQKSSNNSFTKHKLSKNTKRKICREILKDIGYDFNSGRLGNDEYPYTTSLGKKDICITNDLSKDYLFTIKACLHEGGHALYAQNIPDELVSFIIGSGASAGIDEAQAKIYENLIGKSKEFISYLSKKFGLFEGTSIDSVYHELNKIQASCIRLNSDELTFNLHLLIRYEIEKELFNENITTKEIPELWNNKYKDYLGIAPQNADEGVLQDMHWASGGFGYFPTYILGNIYASQLYSVITRDIFNINQLIENGNFMPITEWLSKKVYIHGSIYEPLELLKMTTGETISSTYYIEYLKHKYD